MVVLITDRQRAKRIRIDGLMADPLRPGLDCENPVFVPLRGLPSPVRAMVGLDRESAINVDIEVPCRKCSRCLRRRSRRWAARGAAEISMAIRTWFGTLTVSPAERERLKAQARRYARQRGYGVWEAMTEHERYVALTAQLAPHLTRYLKRVRKEAGNSFRYCAVVEKHKDGFPHMHLLLHEPDGPVRWETLARQWQLGFCQWKLVVEEPGSSKAAYYVAKYLAKQAGVRIRASLRYGQGGKRLLHPLPEGTASNAFPHAYFSQRNDIF